MTRDIRSITGVVFTSKGIELEAQVCGGMSGIGGKTSPLSHQMLFNRVASGRTARRNLELAVDGGEVPVDGAGTDNQLSGQLGIGQPLGHQAQHFHLACGQASGMIG